MSKIPTIDFPMTRERYLATWKIFRSISDENRITAEHITSLNAWQGVNSYLDIGCGDGLISKSIAISNQTAIEKIILLDPDAEIVNEAELHLTELNLVPKIEKHWCSFEDKYLELINKVQAALAVHLVYLISTESFHLLIDKLPVGKKLIIILDDEESVFTKLWQSTAPKYAQRSKYVRQYLDTFSAGKINKSYLNSQIVNPLEQRFDIKDAILSLMSYSDFALMDAATKKFVEETVHGYIEDGHLSCKCVCYEITK